MSKNVFITSDTHFGHSNIIKYCNRPFSDIRSHDDTLIYNINQYVRPNDLLIHCGDFSFGHVEQYRYRIKCNNIILLLGNHDCKRGTTKENYKCFQSVYSHGLAVERTLQYKGEKYPFLFNHYCMMVWNKSHHGVMHCYGHSHSNLEPIMNKLFPNRFSIDVGVDNAYKLLGEYRPFKLEEILKIFSKRKFEPVDHHGHS